MVRRTKDEALATREALLDAAEQVFRACGVTRATLGDVASARGVRWLRAYTLAENQAVMRLIRSLGVPYTAETRRGETTVLLTLRQEA